MKVGQAFRPDVRSCQVGTPDRREDRSRRSDPRGHVLLRMTELTTPVRVVRGSPRVTRGAPPGRRGPATRLPCERNPFPHLSRASQILTVQSSLAEAMRRPSVLNATALTGLVCPLSVSVSSPELASQILTV